MHDEFDNGSFLKQLEKIGAFATPWYVVSYQGSLNQQDTSSGPMATGAAYWSRDGIYSTRPYPLDLQQAKEYLYHPDIGYERVDRTSNRIMYRIYYVPVEENSSDNSQVRLREQALKKLTSDEKKALGLVL